MDRDDSGAVQAVKIQEGDPAAALAARLDAVDDYLGVGCDADEALATAADVEPAALALGEVELAVRARLVQADMLERKGQTAAMARMLWEVNSWAIEHECTVLLVRSHLLLSRTYKNLGDMAVGLEHAVCAVEALAPTTSRHMRAFCLMYLADALKRNGSMDAARERYRQAEQFATAGARVEVLMMVLNNLAYGEYQFGNAERAWAAIERLRSVVATRGMRLGPAEIDTVARTQIALGRYAEAEQTIQSGIRDYHAQGHEVTSYQAEELLTLAVAQRFLGDVDRAQATLDQARRLCTEHGYAAVGVSVQQEQAELYAVAGDFRAAFEAYKAFHAAAEELRSGQREAQARTRQAMFEIREAREEAERFREEARRDPLTKLRNRRYVDETLLPLIDHAATTGAPLTVALVDLDHFKRINDTLSHDVGDRVIVTVAELLSTGLSEVTDAGFVARMGGEEFLIVLPGTTLAHAARHLDDLRITIRSYAWQAVTGEVPVTVSIGVASTETTTSDPLSLKSLLADADRKLYGAKDAERDRVVIDSPPSQPRRKYRDARPSV